MAEITKAHELAKKQREISVSEFFTKNRHLLGFDKPTRALLMAVKEGVDNSVDACDETNVLPEIYVELKKINEERFVIIIEDNGPGIVKNQIPNIFGKLLYGSKFHTLIQNRGQQGIGISAVVLYSQLTTGKPIKVISKISPNKPAQYYEIQIDTQRNEPKILKEEQREWKKEHGTRIEIELDGRYQKGRQSVDEYIKETAIANPHAEIIYVDPNKEKMKYSRAVNEFPKKPKEIKPHPYGVELGTLLWMLGSTTARSVHGFFVNDFSSVGSGTAEEICKRAKINPGKKPKLVTNQEAEALLKSIKETKIRAPPTDCLSPITSSVLEKSLKKEFNADFYTVVSRSPEVYRGFPFIIEVALVYGGDLPKDETARLIRFANRVPLLFQQGACAITEAVLDTNWKPYGMQQSGNNLLVGPLVILVHLCSVWPPFTSEAKDALAHYDEIIREIKLALQEAGRQLGIWIRKNVKAREQQEKVNLFERYIPELASSLSSLTGEKKTKIEDSFKKVLKKNLKGLLENGETAK
ncbi:MAG: DNA topoisomerase VI subunit B [Nanoarchaeota archaeon]